MPQPTDHILDRLLAISVSGQPGINAKIRDDASNAREYLKKLVWFIILLHAEGIISEGQASKVLDMDRVDIRALEDRYQDGLPYPDPDPVPF